MTVRAYAVYVDDSGNAIPDERAQGWLRAVGVEIAVTDAEGGSETKVSTEDDIEFQMLARHSYTIEATCNGSTESIQATIIGYPPTYDGGVITITVRQSSNTIESVSYDAVKFL